MIFALKLGYINGVVFSDSTISKFLGVDEDFTNDLVLKRLLLLKANINSSVNYLISDNNTRNRN